MSFPFRIALLYILLGTSWILLGDNLSNIYFSDASDQFILLLQNVKGIFYVVITGILLFYLVRKHENKVKRDSTLLKQQQQRLLTQNKEFDTLINNTESVIWSIDKNFRLISYNKNFAHFYEVIGGTKAFVGKEMGADPAQNFKYEWKGLYERCLRGESFQVDQVVKSLKADLEVNFTPIRVGGEIIGINCFAHDITNRKKLESDLSQSRKNYEVLFDESPFPLMLCDKTTFRILKVNIAAVDKYGYSEKQFRHLALSDLRLPEDQDTLPLEINNLNFKHRIEVVCRNITAGKEVISVNFLAHLITYEDREVIFASVSDISDIQLAEARIFSAQMEAIDIEREQISREIHDGLVQSLTASAIYFNSVYENITSRVDEQSSTKFAKAHALLNQSITHARGISHNLMPKSVVDFGLQEILHEVIENFQEVGAFEIEFENNLPDISLSDKMKLNIYRITQEALNNIHRHANASRVSFKTWVAEEKLFLHIEDNGRGFEIGMMQKKLNRLGVRSIRNRAALMNGVLNIYSEVGKGTRIILSVPVEA